MEESPHPSSAGVGKDKAVRSVELLLPTGKKCIRATSQLYPLETSFLDLNVQTVKPPSITTFILPSLFLCERLTSPIGAPTYNMSDENGTTESWGPTPNDENSRSPAKKMEALSLHREPMDTSGSSTTQKTENKRRIPKLPTSFHDGSMDERSNGFPNQFAENGRSTPKGGPQFVIVDRTFIESRLLNHRTRTHNQSPRHLNHWTRTYNQSPSLLNRGKGEDVSRKTKVEIKTPLLSPLLDYGTSHTELLK